MKKTAKKIISAVLVLLMVISAVPLSCISGIDWFGVKAAAATYAVGNIVKFGSYPQSQVTDVTLKASLGEASYGITNGYFYYNGERYYRYTVSSTTYFYKDQPIYWRVLSVGSDGIYLLAETVLDQHVYNESYGSDYTWENSSLRTWLNGTFYDTAFSASEKSAIRTSTLINDGTYTGPDTQDKIFVPSYDDMSSAYGLGTSSSRIAPASDFAKNKGVYYSGSGAYWWLRTRSYYDSAYYVNYSGDIYDYYYYLYNTYIGVRPALKLNLNSSIAESTSGYVLSFMDSESGETLSGVTVSSDGATYTSGADGRVTFSKTNLVSNKTLTVSKSGYTSQTVKVSELSNTIVNYIFMEPTGSDPYGIKAQMKNVDFGTVKVQGPSFDLFGETVYFFTVDAGLQIKLSDYSFKADYDEDNKTLKVIFGIKDGVEMNSHDEFRKNYEDFKDFFDISNQKNSYKWRQSYNKIESKLEKKPGVAALNFDLSVAGFATFDVSDGTLKWDSEHLVESGFSIAASANYTQDFPFWYVFYGTFTAGGEVGVTFTYDVSNTGSWVEGLSSESKLDLSVSVGVGAKALSKKVASLEAGLEGHFITTMTLPADSLAECFNVKLTGKAYYQATLFCMSTGKKTIAGLEGEVQLYPKSSSAKKSVMLMQAPVAEVDSSDFTLQSRDYLDSRQTSSSLRMVKSSGTETDLFKKYAVYPNGSPSIIQCGDNKVAVWVEDDGTKDAANLTTLYYAVYNGTTWSTPKAVCENGTADFEAEICTDGTNVYAVWQRATKEFDDSVTLDDYVNNNELVYSVFNGTSWSSPVTVGNSGNVATEYAIAENNGSVIIAWSENSNNDYMYDEGTNSVYMQTITEGVASEAELVNDNLGSIDSLCAGVVNGVVSVAYSAGNAVYVNDTQISADETTNTSVKYNSGKLYWLCDSIVYCYDGTASSSGISANTDFQVVTNGTKTAVLYTEKENYVDEIYVSYLEDGTYTVPVAITSYGKGISSFSAVMNDDGTITVASDLENLADDDADYPYTTTDFVVETLGEYVNISVEDNAYYDESEIGAGKTVTFSTTVSNIGTADVSALNVRLLDESGNTLASSAVSKTIRSGESSDVAITYTLPATISKTNVKLVVETDGDVDTTDNTASAEYGYADIMVENYAITDNGTVIARVVNQGFEDAENVTLDIDKFDDGENNLTTLDIGTLEPGERKSVTYDVPDESVSFTENNQRNLFLIKAVTDTEEVLTANNDAEVSLYPTDVESITLNKTELELPTGGTYNLYAAVTPLTAFDKSITWITTDTSVADVDETGKVTATGAGTATITAVSSNSDVVANCIVTVSDEKEVVAVTGISLDTEELSMIVGEKKSVTATVSPADATYSDVIWTSGDESIALVDQTGKIYAVGVGSTEITAKTADGEFTKTVEVEVKTATYTVTWVINGNITTETYQVGDKIVVPEAPEIAGYEFNGWTPEVPETMPAKDVTYTAVYGIKHVHSYTSSAVSEPTCTQAGMMLYTCACGDSYTSDIPALGHTATAAVRENETAATCTSEGSYDEVIYCSVCKTEISRKTGNKIPALGHLDANNDGTCERCGVVFNNPCKNASLNTSGGSVDYKTKVTLKATASGVPTGYYVAIYDGNTQVARGDNSSVTYNIGSMTSGKTYTVKIVDANGNVQKDGSGNALQKEVNISVNSGFFKKLVAFFKGLFGSLPSKTIGA